MITNLEDFKVYNLAMKLGEDVWSIVSKLNYFEKDTVGKQFVRAVDSKESKNFSYYSRGSLFETKTWLVKSKDRGLLSETDFKRMMNTLDEIGRMLNAYIKS